MARRTGFLEGLALALTGGLLTSYHTYNGDCVLLIPAASIIVWKVRDHLTVPAATLSLMPLVFAALVGACWAYGVQATIIAMFIGSAVHLLRSGAVFGRAAET